MRFEIEAVTCLFPCILPKILHKGHRLHDACRPHSSNFLPAPLRQPSETGTAGMPAGQREGGRLIAGGLQACGKRSLRIDRREPKASRKNGKTAILVILRVPSGFERKDNNQQKISRDLIVHFYGTLAVINEIKSSLRLENTNTLPLGRLWPPASVRVCVLSAEGPDSIGMLACGPVISTGAEV